MMRIAFNDFATKNFFAPGDVVGEATVFKGKSETVPLITKENVKLLLHRSALDDATATIVYEGPVLAPIQAEQQIGYLRVESNHGAAKEYPLYAGASVKEIGVFGKIGLGSSEVTGQTIKTD